jgi:hypothetical protein
VDRREFLRGLALGGVVVAGELWIPGQKLISIPKISNPYDQVAVFSRGRIMTAAAFRAILLKELNETFKDVYSAYPTHSTSGSLGADLSRRPL